MREEISEPQQWRSHSRRETTIAGSRGSRRQSATQGSGLIATLPCEAIDAVFDGESISVESVRGSRRDMASQKPTGTLAAAEQMQSAEGNDLLQNLSAQLAALKTQQEHLQELLVQARDN